MKLKHWTGIFLLCILILPVSATAREGARNWHIINRLRLEYDDNIRQVDRDTTSSWKIIEELEFQINFNLEQTFVGLRYKPSFIWWENRSEDSTDLHHDFDFILNHEFSPNVTLSVKDTFRYAELPELIERGVVVRQENDFIYNMLKAALTYRWRPKTRLEVAGRYDLLRYDEDEVADRHDYDLYVFGLSMMHSLLPETTVGGEFRYESLDYEDVVRDLGDEIHRIRRDSESYQFGGVMDHMFNPSLLGNARAGLQYKDYEDSDISSETAPYIDGAITYVLSPATRITTGASYSLFDANIFPYANQTRARLYGSIAHDLTARVTFTLAGNYTRGEYKEGDIPAEIREQYEVPEGSESEDIYQLSSRIVYQVNRNNWVELGWQYVKLDTDVRMEYERNRFNVGWRARL